VRVLAQHSSVGKRAMRSATQGINRTSWDQIAMPKGDVRTGSSAAGGRALGLNGGQRSTMAPPVSS